MTNKTTTLRKRIEKQLNTTFGLNTLHPAQLGQMTKFLENEVQEAERKVIDKCVLERKSVKELLDTMGSLYTDLPSQIAFKEGYNNAVIELQAKILEIRKELNI